MGYVTQRFTPGYREIDGTDLNNFVDQVNAGPGSGPTYYVNETIGSDYVGNAGFNPYLPLKTIDRALVLEKAALSSKGLASVGRNAVIAFWGAQNRTATLTWDAPATHLIGLSNGVTQGKRARIQPSSSLAGTAGFDKLVSVTAQGCLFSNFRTFYGFSNTAAALICWYETAGRTMYDNVEFLGFGDNTGSTGTGALTGARAYKMNSTNGESTFRNCLFGTDSTTRSATNYTVEIVGPAARLSFFDCDFDAWVSAGGANGSHLLLAASSIDRYIRFIRCNFDNGGVASGGVAMAQALNVSLTAGGSVRLIDCSSYGVTALQTTPTANVVMNMVAATTTGGIDHIIF